jgi:hypothetical protein
MNHELAPAVHITPGTIGANNELSHDQQRRAEWRSPISGTR